MSSKTEINAEDYEDKYPRKNVIHMADMKNLHEEFDGELIGDLIEYLQELQDQNPDCRIEISNHGYGADIDWELACSRPETTAEWHSRIIANVKRAQTLEDKKAREAEAAGQKAIKDEKVRRDLYEKLKKEFG